MTNAPAVLSKPRFTNLELFRILTMLLIVAHHYVVNSTLTAPGGAILSSPMSAPSVFLQLFGAWGKTGINCFVLITGYFMCQSEISLRKFLKLLLEVMFYRLAIYFVFCICGQQTFSVVRFAKLLLPVASIGTGFTGAFLMFYLFIPFINILLRAMNRKQHLWLLALLSFMYVLFGTFRFLLRVDMNYVSWFFVLYLFSAYVRMYPARIFDRTRLWGFLRSFPCSFRQHRLSPVRGLRKKQAGTIYSISSPIPTHSSRFQTLSARSCFSKT